jgi:hypothetical protein
MIEHNNLGWATDVLSQSARTYLIDYFEEDKTYHEKNYNLRKVWQNNIDYEDPIQAEMVDRVQLAAETTTRMKLSSCRNAFLCDYVEGSWAKGHTDNPDASDCSVITMIDLSQDLVGGEAYFAKTKQSLDYHKMIPGPLENGDSLMYGGEMYHGVEEVFSGRRLVLITWFKEDV